MEVKNPLDSRSIWGKLLIRQPAKPSIHFARFMTSTPYHVAHRLVLIALCSGMCGLFTADPAFGQSEKRKGAFGKLFKRKTEDIPPGTTPQAAESSAKPAEIQVVTDKKSQQLKEVLMQAIPADRHYRDVLSDAIVLAYKRSNYRNLWNHRHMPDRVFKSLSYHLARHGLPGMLALDPHSLSGITRSAPVNQKDLSYTIAIADAGMLVRMGGVATDQIWADWNKGDRPGDNRHDAHSISVDLLRIRSQGTFDAGLAVDSFAPRNWVYRELQNAYYASRRAMDSKAAEHVPDPSTAGLAYPGKAYDHAPALATALADRGHLRMAAPQRDQLTSITPDLADAIRSFQRANGLQADGIMGSGTWRRLRANPAAQLKARALNLHRARLLPDGFGDRYLIVNLPSAEVYAFEKGDNHSFSMRVVHGKTDSDEYHTPVFRDIMREVVFAPYWNVPESIAVKEIYPKLVEDLTYLERNRYEIVGNFNDNAEIYELNEETLAKIGEAKLWLRQKPTGANALGKVKFLLPNQFNIYLHDTPAKQYFAMDDRARSHGCIRVAEPPLMAEWVLGPQGIEAEAITAAMDADAQSRESVKKPVNVFVTYFTTFPRPSEQGYAITAPRDVYQRDAVDQKVLAAYMP